MIILDTNVLIALMNDGRLRAGAVAAVRAATLVRGVLISSVSAWEIGLLATRTGRTAFLFKPDGRNWFAAVARLPGIRLLPLDDSMALEAAYLPGDFHHDPADRLLVASARALGMPLVTKDRAILAYAAAGPVGAIDARA